MKSNFLYFKTNNHDKISSAVIAVLCLIFYIVSETFFSGQMRVIASVISSLAFTLITTSWLSAYFIVKPDYNEIVNNIIFGGLLKNQEFLNNINSELKKEYCSAITENVFCNGSDARLEIHKQFVNRLIASERVCYACLNINVEATVKEDKIIKKITKYYQICSLDGDKKIEKHLVAKGTYNNKNHLNSFYDKVSVDGSYVEFKVEKVPNYLSEDLKQCDTSEECRLINPIEVSNYCDNKHIKEIKVEYRTEVSINDLSYICRCSYPCKRFSFKFTLRDENDKNNYKLVPHFFGNPINKIIKKGPNDDKHVDIEFSDWVFSYDGVAVFLERI